MGCLPQQLNYFAATKTQILDRNLRDLDLSAPCPLASGLDDRLAAGLAAPCLLRLSRDPISRSLQDTPRRTDINLQDRLYSAL